MLYAVLVSLFVLAWFSLEYLKNRGWFHHRYGGVEAIVPVPEMSEHHGSEVQPASDLENGYSRVGTEEGGQLNNSKRSRFSSWFPFNRGSTSKRSETVGMPYPGLYDGATTSVDTSRAPSAVSPAIGGLAPGPGRRDDVPPVPTLPTQYERSNSSVPNSDYRERYGDGNLASLKDTVLRDSTTLGPRPGQHLEMPDVEHFDQYHNGQIAPAFGASPRSSQRQTYEQMPVSPISGGGYMEDEHGFVPTPVQDDLPSRPLPMPPHRRGQSSDSATRGPTAGSRSSDTFPGGDMGQTILVGPGAGEPSRRGGVPPPNVAVQVKLNPDGKSVTVRRLNPEEAEHERRERSRVRQDRARQRELEIERERERETRRSHSRRRQAAFEEDRLNIRSPDGSSLTQLSGSAVSGQSTTIADASGGLLGRAGAPASPVPRNMMGSGQRGASTSGTGTAENSEIEQEIVKEQRRKKRREERAGGNSQLGAGGGAAAGGGAGYYGPAGSESQWT